MTKKIKVGSLYIGGDFPVTIQSMTSTDTLNIDETVSQVEKLAQAGCELVRIAVPSIKACDAFSRIKEKVGKFSNIPLIADIHFDYRLAIKAIEAGADKIRINPGNIGDHEDLGKVVEALKKHNIPVRIGVNSGSLKKETLLKYSGPTPEALVESALEYIDFMEKRDYRNLVLSVKSSDVKKTFEAYRLLSEKTDYPLHLGVTEAGTPETGKIKSAAGIGALLLLGIGDTLRVSLTSDPVSEVVFAKELLKALNLREGLNIISCPTCGRTKVDLLKVANSVEQSLLREGLGSKAITVAVMGCGVNGPGEAREADFGVACGENKGVIFKKGKPLMTVREEKIEEELVKVIKTFIKES